MRTHGKASTYRDGCKCVPCRNAMTRKRRVEWQRYRNGERLYRPAVEGQRLVQELRSMNWTDREIAADGLLNPNTVYRIGNGLRKWVHVDTVKTLTALIERGARPERHRGRVSIGLTQSALRGLQAQGWTAQWIGDRLGTSHQVISQYTRGKVKWVHPDLERRAVALAREVGSKQGPSSYVRAVSLKKGWKPTIWVDELV